MAEPQRKTRPSYAVASVDHALRLASILQLEGKLTVKDAADRLEVARSTAHRLLVMLVYRDFAVQDEDRVYRPGPVLELAGQSRSHLAHLRAAALPHLEHLSDVLQESVNLIVRTGATARFIVSVEGKQALRVGSREGMAFPAHKVTGGLVLLAELTNSELEAVYSDERFEDRPEERPDLVKLARELRAIKKNGFAVNRGLSERGVVAVGRAVRDAKGTAIAGVSVPMPSARYDPEQLELIVATLNHAAAAIENELRASGVGSGPCAV